LFGNAWKEIDIREERGLHAEKEERKEKDNVAGGGEKEADKVQSRKARIWGSNLFKVEKYITRNEKGVEKVKMPVDSGRIRGSLGYPTRGGGAKKAERGVKKGPKLRGD